MNDEVKAFEERIKNYLITQKAEYMRFANQINQMIQNSKEINSQLTLLGNKFEEFQKNVGIWLSLMFINVLIHFYFLHKSLIQC